VLDEQFELSQEWHEDEDGCIVIVKDVDGKPVEFHHWIPDDSAPHVPDTACGCGPQPEPNPDNVILFWHLDQDDEAQAVAR
jgi:hypothetical protein